MVILKRLFAFSVVFVLFLFSDPASAAILQSQTIFDEDEVNFNDVFIGLDFTGDVSDFVFKATCKNIDGCEILPGDFEIVFYNKCDQTTTNYSNETTASVDYAETVDLTITIPTETPAIINAGDFLYFSSYNADFTWNGQGGQTDFFLKYESCPSYAPVNASGYYIINGALVDPACDFSTSTDVFYNEWLSYDDIGKETRITYDKDGSHYVAINKPFNLYLFFYSLVFSLMVIIFFFYYK